MVASFSDYNKRRDDTEVRVTREKWCARGDSNTGPPALKHRPREALVVPALGISYTGDMEF